MVIFFFLAVTLVFCTQLVSLIRLIRFLNQKNKLRRQAFYAVLIPLSILYLNQSFQFLFFNWGAPSILLNYYLLFNSGTWFMFQEYFQRSTVRVQLFKASIAAYMLTPLIWTLVFYGFIFTMSHGYSEEMRGGRGAAKKGLRAEEEVVMETDGGRALLTDTSNNENSTFLSSMNDKSMNNKIQKSTRSVSF